MYLLNLITCKRNVLSSAKRKFDEIKKA